MAILARIPHDGKLIDVEVLDAWQSSRGKVALVRALDGREHFTNWTHGGWATSATATVLITSLRGVACERACVQATHSEIDLPAAIPQEVQL